MAPASGLPTSGVYKVGKPYQIKGVWHYPSEDFTYDETGIASWYGPDVKGKATANGEIHDENELTAAHPTLPLPSLLRVTNLDNGRSIVVRLNDRGPSANNRVIGLSRRGAQLLGFEAAGTAKVRVQILADETRTIAAAARRGTPAAILAESDGPAPQAAPRARVEMAGGMAAPVPTAILATDIPPPGSVPGGVVGGRFLPAPVVTERPVRPGAQIYVQAGAFGSAEAVSRARARLAALGQQASVTKTVSGRQTLQRVRVGPMRDVGAADALLNRLLDVGLTDAKIIVD
ncbi:septal ring lytic transglycosylase RlpA family protein [Azospirillum sp. SYSU D00513]|uniref:septal ring lytic transglycosylase RlpA family protein n=1 Tax=Azospirillum sp. SYSU D00513 TaxID=2812561 RepID=UPI0032B573A3